ncbi:MAG: class I SAM-dependent methyltransferase [Proteobacteria bacterium]|nr:MAG: class I SAM-dependent methyltransferase [Pseudomonadota bacterium]
MANLFQADDPFPAVGPGVSYAEEKAHSAEVDAWLGLRIIEAETKVQDPGDGAQRWLHVPPETFLTPYTELRRMIELCAPAENELVVDLGAGYGRLGFVIERHTRARFLGLELVAERVAEGSLALARFGAKRAELREADLAAPGFKLPPAAWYFVYDYGTRAAIEKTLGDLQILARHQRVRVVGRGRAVRDAIERRHPWLSGVVDPRHHGNFSLYSSSDA